MKKTILVCPMLLLLLAACSSNGTLNEAQPTETEVQATVVRSPTLSRTLTATALPPTATMAQVLSPTLTTDQRKDTIQNMLLSSAGCLLSCWWGIEPGITTWKETEEFLNQLGASTSVFNQDNGETFHSTGGFDLNNENIFHKIYIFERDGVISNTEVHGSGSANPPKFKELWAQYGPEMIISKYGIPTRVWVQSIKNVHEGEPGPTMPYNLWVFYDQLGFLIRYSGQVIYQDMYVMCPTFQDGGNLEPSIDLFMTSPKTHVSLEDLTDYENIPKSQIIPLGEATELTLEEFTALLSQDEHTPCFETPKDKWP